mgnify:CR=1 FL=1
MALVLETGAGLSNATSSASVAEADAYSARQGPSSTATKEAALNAASRFLAQTYEGRWQGYRVRQEQALPWPRSGVYDSDEFPVGWNSVPLAVKHATIEAAARHAAGTVLAPDQAGAGTVEVDRIKVGPIELETRYANAQVPSGSSPTERFPVIERLLRPLLRSGNEVRLG